ncbi:MAG TPA: hypothetical protein VM899_07045, partial [Rubellimicrobium sp.]|nr:hypothetical protein [Rubellimicrobium sp.]
MKSVLFASTALIGLSAAAALAGGLAPPVGSVQAAPVVTIPFIATCPSVQPALTQLVNQGYTDIVARVGATQVRVDAMLNGELEQFIYDCGVDAPGPIGVGFDGPNGGFDGGGDSHEDGGHHGKGGNHSGGDNNDGDDGGNPGGGTSGNPGDDDDDNSGDDDDDSGDDDDDTGDDNDDTGDDDDDTGDDDTADDDDDDDTGGNGGGCRGGDDDDETTSDGNCGHGNNSD